MAPPNNQVQCSVYGCLISTVTNPEISFFKLPTQRARLSEWLQLICRQDLENNPNKGTHRVCEKHFHTKDILQNSKRKLLKNNVLPVFNLPEQEFPQKDKQSQTEHEINVKTTVGQCSIAPKGRKLKADLCERRTSLRLHDYKTEIAEPYTSDKDNEYHPNLACNGCEKQIRGSLYKCVSCHDYDLCKGCEDNDVHSHHILVKIPRPMSLKFVEKLTRAVRELVAGYQRSDDEGSSEDDVPIQRLARNYDSGVDLADDVKDVIRKEVNRVLKLKPSELRREDTKKTITNKTNKHKTNKKRTRSTQESGIPEKQAKSLLRTALENKDASNSYKAPELFFADVNEDVDAKIERDVGSKRESHIGAANANATFIQTTTNQQGIIMAPFHKESSMSSSFLQPSSSTQPTNQPTITPQTTTNQPSITIPQTTNNQSLKIPCNRSVITFKSITTPQSQPAQPSNQSLINLSSIATNQPTITNQTINQSIINEPILTNQQMITNQTIMTQPQIPNQTIITNQSFITNQSLVTDQSLAASQSLATNQPSCPEQPVMMHVKLSDDLTQLMIEVTENNQKSFYKYPDGSQ